MLKRVIKSLFIAGFLIFTSLFGTSFYQTIHEDGYKRVASEAFDNLFHFEFYQALANPSLSYVRIPSGMRKEQIASALVKRFKWDDGQAKEFTAFSTVQTKKVEGKYYPDLYVVSKDIGGKEFKEKMFERFGEKTKSVQTLLDSGKINLDTALIIASIIEREAAGPEDMKLISGIIWNRLFEGMSLQMDATLQYVKGNETIGWWPQVSSADKKLVSPYNTYKIKGLPPSPISNPSMASIEAALSPQKTSCLYYIHKDRQIYCSKTYEEHKQNIETYLK